MEASRAAGMRSEGPVVELVSAGFAYDTGDLALADVTFRVAQGEFVAVVGPNGSGKSTLIKLALGLLRPTSGVARLFGVETRRFRDWHAVGYVPQVAAGVRGQFPATAAELVAQGLYLGFAPFAFWRRRVDGRVMAALESVNAAHLWNRRIGEMSVGQHQRVLLARALVKQPRLLVLDEPAAGVDIHGEEQIYDILRRLNRDSGISVLLVTHDIGAIVREATSVACVNRTLVFHGPARQLTAETLSSIYGFPVNILLHDDAPLPAAERRPGQRDA
ncbi:MAG: metal ABC transporter ATP-binding protein [SAR202 cluster bacterium]|nr:metal ABC transporter ATP-binding protein [SAR202 cluster bacterium]